MHILPWPAQCSDLNPIEHLWDYLDRKISCSEGKFHQTFEDALKAVLFNRFKLENLKTGRQNVQ
jgi:hypothetical protein